MKPKIQSIILLLTITCTITTSSCNKDKEPLISQNTPTPTIPPRPSGMLIGNMEYFWERSWQETSGVYEMKLETYMLTDSTINRGIQIYTAIYSGWSSFEYVPSTLHNIFLPDTVNLSYTVTAGHLKVFARAPFEITWPSDIMIKYQ